MTNNYLLQTGLSNLSFDMILTLYQIAHNFNIQTLINSYIDVILKNLNQKNVISTLQFLIFSGNFQFISPNQFHYSYLRLLIQSVVILMKHLKVILNTKDARQLLIIQDILIYLFQLPILN